MRLMKDYSGLFFSFCVSLIVVTVAGTFFASLLIKEGVPRLDILVLSNMLTGAIVGILFVQSRLREAERQRLTKERLAKIAEMNHHIRNALQVVAFYATHPDDSIAVGTIRDAIHRIEWTLREVLPKGWNLEQATAADRARYPPPSSVQHVDRQSPSEGQLVRDRDQGDSSSVKSVQ